MMIDMIFARFIYQGTSTRRQQWKLCDLRVKLPSVRPTFV